MVRRNVLRAVNSGLIQIAFDGVLNRIEFNCNCLDALEVCQAQCCRRSGYSVELEPDEVGRFRSVPHPTRLGVTLLAKKDDGLSCYYLGDAFGTCTIYERRPTMCRQWHCSPRGQEKDLEIVVRDAGWVLSPLRKEEADAVQAQLGGSQ
jgi:hypothetical protein